MHMLYVWWFRYICVASYKIKCYVTDELCYLYRTTVDVERFTGLNVRGFNPIEVSVEILSHYLGQKGLLCS